MKQQTLRVSVTLMIGLPLPAAGRGVVEGLKVKADNGKVADSVPAKCELCVFIIGIEQGFKYLLKLLIIRRPSRHL